jgi:hypothetical protein
MKALILLAVPAVAAAQSGVGTEFLASSDSEGFGAQRVSAEYLTKWRAEDKLGLRVSNTHYDQAQWHADAQRISAVGRSGDYANGWAADVGLSSQAGHQTITGEASYTKTVVDGTVAEAFVSRDWVETERALRAGTAHTFVGASVEQRLAPKFTVVGTIGEQVFTDSNRRVHERLKLIYQPDLDLGLTFQVRVRAFQGRDQATTYFNPRRYDEQAAAVGYRSRIQGWTISSLLGAGREHVNGVGQATRIAELGTQSPQKAGFSVNVRAGYSRSASFGGPAYAYRYIMGEIVFPIK